ncbi:hypothetical protein R6Q59_001699 [Mikania micrantha]|uniref:Uncharacterized protein n=1 Tax=Mikania micrantha TaxID=192012 RepID=A0A5N6NLX6_9ASTR|nr:hypothetical protein E3N88_18790 [Mikania micrantha]
MAYAGLPKFMEKLKQLISCNDHPLTNYPEIIREKPQFQLLLQDLGSMIQTLYIDEHQDLQEHVKLTDDLKERFTHAAEEAQYIVDLFLSGVHSNNNGYFPTSEEFKRFLYLDDVRRSFESFRVEFMSMRIINMELDSSPRPGRTLNQSADAVRRNSSGSKKIPDDMIIVGIDEDAKLIKDKLMEDRKKLDVVSVVGMGGIGKTTLATKVFNDSYVKYHFHVRVWVTVSQTYDKRHVFTQILESIRGRLDLGVASDSRLRELVHKQLKGKRYLIVIDDIWHIETWDSLKLFFPHDNKGSRILLTSRFVKVARHANSDGLIHQLEYWNKEKSWELLRKKMFHGNDCPEWSIEPGKQIVKNCKGLPLAVAVIAGVLAKDTHSEKFWVDIAYRTGSYIVDDQNGSVMESLALSYNHLPLHLRECFLYLGGFREDYKFKVRWLILLWVAEGFIQEDGNRSLEDIAEGYLIDLIDRNLVVVEVRNNSNGGVKACKVHDLVRELCLRKAQEEGFILQTGRQTSSSHFSNLTTPPHNPMHMIVDNDPNIRGFPNPSSQNLWSILCFNVFRSLSDANFFGSFVLLRVLDLHNCNLKKFPKGMELLVHLRYLAIYNSSDSFPSSICNLWGLQTLIYIPKGWNDVVLPGNISDLVNLRHLLSHHPLNRHFLSTKGYFILPSIKKPMNLQTFSYVKLGDGVDFQTYFPFIKELRCWTNRSKENDFKSFSYLEKLKLITYFNYKLGHITFPATLKTLTLVNCGLSWSEMPIIQSLPNLQVLKIGMDAFEGSCWNTHEHEFPRLTFLKLYFLDIKLWKPDSTSFPCLKQLEIEGCKGLEEIPLEIGEIPTLELIKITYCRQSVGESVRRIQQEQHYYGNYDLKVDVRHELPA